MKKKYLSIMLILALSITMLVGCGNNDVDKDDTGKDTETEDIVETEEDEETDSTEEDSEIVEDETVFDYLPEINKNAKLDDHQEASGDQMEKAVYTIENEEAEVVIDEYIEQLEKDGWEIVEDDSPELVRATKDEHEVIVAVGQNEEDVTLTILSK